MDLLPRKRVNTNSKTSPNTSAGASLGRGMEFAILVLMFLGVGYGLDSWFGTKPVFMIVMVVVGLVGQFASMWYGYESRMKELEEQRRDATRHGKAAAR
jgi:F0F1-type ATP synthase assembly protein I